MQDKDAGISLETHEVQDNKVYRHCFSGKFNSLVTHNEVKCLTACCMANDFCMKVFFQHSSVKVSRVLNLMIHAKHFLVIL